VVAPWRFGGQLASAIRRLKFANRAHVARDVAPLWAPALAAAVAEQDAVVVPVPLHWRRRCVRGYDHISRDGKASSGSDRPPAAQTSVQIVSASIVADLQPRHRSADGQIGSLDILVDPCGNRPRAYSWSLFRHRSACASSPARSASGNRNV
jgi:hypothetical protein